MVREPEQSYRRPRFLAGDSLRAFAALFVIVGHAGFGAVGALDPGPDSPLLRDELGELGPWIRHSHVAPIIFFVLSGYLIAQPFVGSLVTGRPLPSVRRYFQRRAFRILPAFWVAVGLTILVHGTLGASPVEVLALPTFAQVYFPSELQGKLVQAWTLDVEVIYYLAVPLLGLVAARLIAGRGTPLSRALLLGGGVTALAAVSLVYHVERAPGTNWFATFPSVAYQFAPGVLAAIFEPLVRRRLSGTRLGQVIAIGAVPLTVGLLLVYIYSQADGIGYGRSLFGLVTGTMIIVGPLTWEWWSGRGWSVLTSRPMAWIGERAYSMYLFHLLILAQLTFLRDGHAPLAGFFLTVPLMIALSLVAGAIGYRFIERPFIDGRWAPRSLTAPGPPAAVAQAQAAP